MQVPTDHFSQQKKIAHRLRNVVSVLVPFVMYVHFDCFGERHAQGFGPCLQVDSIGL